MKNLNGLLTDVNTNFLPMTHNWKITEVINSTHDYAKVDKVFTHLLISIKTGGHSTLVVLKCTLLKRENIFFCR